MAVLGNRCLYLVQSRYRVIRSNAVTAVTLRIRCNLQKWYHSGPMRKTAIAVLLSCAISIAWSQAQPAPSSPTPRPPCPDPGQFWRDATVALGQVVQIGGQSKFVVSGTGVIVALDDKRGCILTARHMLVDPATGMVTRFLWMRISTVHGEEEEPVPLSLFDPLGHNIWVALPDNDLAVIPIPFSAFAGRKISAVPVSNFVSNPDDIFQGAQVLVLGFPQVFRNPDQTNPYSTVPIARTGIVAWIDPTDPLGNPFLVDANLYGGNSGGPVFRVRNGFDKYGNFNIGTGGLEFIGIVSRGASCAERMCRADRRGRRSRLRFPIPARGTAT